MNKVMKKLSQNVFFLIVAVLFCTPFGWAQEEDPVQAPEVGIPCVTKAKGFMVHFTAYQQVDIEKEEEEEGKRKLEFERFCHDLPITGITLITIDLMDRYTRSRPVALRIVEIATGEKPGNVMETRTLVQAPEKKYRAGLIETRVDFDKRGLYAAILTIEGEEISIPIRVGIEEEIPLVRRMLPIIFGLLILAALGYAIYRFRSSSAAKAKDKKEEEKEENEEKEEEKDKD
ncbi:conserved hypothetical protein [Nitrosococcus halophilus Nc 4]|uniref:Transmembrane protein n=1 Tax=Nitrosococcus halophilus (strain Nc4) TaxID=472759 RepID=D5C397_NITHN|nr:hypothetical protein [Nitrosococcus halophilus]ADE16804.1 conserved hypothetical protein [Nitrosococcus halophilus Nc 4]